MFEVGFWLVVVGWSVACYLLYRHSRDMDFRFIDGGGLDFSGK